MSASPDWSGTPDDERRACLLYWLRLTPERRAWLLSHYDKLIAINNGTFDPGRYTAVNLPRGSRARPGDRRPYPDKFPQMQEAYERGRQWLAELIEAIDGPVTFPGAPVLTGNDKAK